MATTHTDNNSRDGGIAGLSETPRGERLHITLLGRRNAGKSSLINALAHQEVAITSSTPGTTTDPVYKAMEILPIGPVILIDTAGLDDEGILGEERVRKSLSVLDKTDIAVLVVDALTGWGTWEDTILLKLNNRAIPTVLVLNKSDLVGEPAQVRTATPGSSMEHPPWIPVSAYQGLGIDLLKEALIQLGASTREEPSLMGDLVSAGDTVVLVAPIDRSAPKGRLILPQVQAIRDLLDHRAQALVVQETELASALNTLQTAPRLVVTDSQVFKVVNELTPPHISLTSFSILFARYKGDLSQLVSGAKAIENLKPGDQVLIAEACTHHRTDDDIGTVKIPRWLEQKIGGPLSYTWVNGGTLPENLDSFKLVIHCGACMLNRRQMLSRLERIRRAGVPVANYGVTIAYLHGILERVLSPFPLALAVLQSASTQADDRPTLLTQPGLKL